MKVNGLLILVTIMLSAFPAWARGGTLREYIASYPLLAVIALFIYLLAPLSFEIAERFARYSYERGR